MAKEGLKIPLESLLDSEGGINFPRVLSPYQERRLLARTFPDLPQHPMIDQESRPAAQKDQADQEY